MKHFSFFMFVAVGIVCAHTMHAMEKEEDNAKEQVITPSASTDITNQITLSDSQEINLTQPHAKKRVHTPEKFGLGIPGDLADKLQTSLDNLDIQPKQEQDEIEKILNSHKEKLDTLIKKGDALDEHVRKLHDAIVHLKKPVHYSLHLPSAIGLTKIGIVSTIFTFVALHRAIKKDDTVKNIYMAFFCSGISAWSLAQANHYWQAFFTPTISEKEEKKIEKIEHQILNDQTAGANK